MAQKVMQRYAHGGNEEWKQTPDITAVLNGFSMPTMRVHTGKHVGVDLLGENFRPLRKQGPNRKPKYRVREPSIDSQVMQMSWVDRVNWSAVGPTMREHDTE